MNKNDNFNCVGCEAGMAGRAMTPYYCEDCGDKHIHNNTNTPKLCQKCARKESRCQYCGIWKCTY